MYIGLHVKYPLFLSDFNDIWIFSTDIWKILKYQISWISAQWVLSCSMLTDGRTDMTKQTVIFRNIANAPKRNYFLHQFAQHWQPEFYRSQNQISYCPSCYLMAGDKENLKKIETWKSQRWEKNVARFRSKELVWIKASKLHFQALHRKLLSMVWVEKFQVCWHHFPGKCIEVK